MKSPFSLSIRLMTRTASSLEYFQRKGTPIVAVATALGGPVAIIRVSGNDLSFLERCTGSLPQAGTAVLRSLKDSKGQFLDEALVIFFKGPKSFTGEDVVEIQGHGVPALVDRIVNEIVSLGARPALPGEFSFRAVLNNKMSLDDASRLQSVFANEGLGASSAAKLLGFSRSQEEDIQKLFDQALLSVASARGRVEAAIDFSEAEEEQAQDIASAQTRLEEVRRTLRDLLNSYEVFVSNSRVPRVVLFGRPNVGKSTLLNLMCGSRRSLVSSVAGTTRDYVEVTLKTEKGISFRLVDTAGLRFLASTSSDLRDPIEEAGIEMGLELMEGADVLVWIQDARDVRENFDEERVDRILSKKKCVRILSHADKLSPQKIPVFEAFDFVGELSSRKARNYVFEAIDKALFEKYSEDSKDAAFSTLLSQRQETQIREALFFLDEALDCLSGARPLEIIGDSLRGVELALRRAKGEGVSEDYIGQIFTQFCLGK